MNRLALLTLVALSFGFLAAPAAAAPSGPNIVLVMADDLGYGDLGAYNSESKVPTPHLDRLASEGLRFTDAHAPASLCVPTRYGLITGRYAWRNKVRRASGGGYAGSLIEKGRMTIGSLLKEHGYATACVGKWHQGFGDPAENVDFSKKIKFGPHQLGFDYFFGLPASLDIPPYVYIENDRATEPLDRTIEASETPGARWAAGAFWRGGKTTASFKHDEVLATFTKKAVGFIESRAKASADQPFFLYLALTAPHTPWLPTGKYRGTSGAGDYGDFTAQVDGSVGEVLQALRDLRLADSTLVIFTSDNGAFWVEEEIERYKHRANGQLRGQKGDIWEGGHRMPFIARWPGKIKPGTTNDQLLCLTDMLATFAAIVGVTNLPRGAGEDSFNMLPAFLGQSQAQGAIRSGMIHHCGGGFAIREGEWKLITFLGSGGFTKPKRVRPAAGDPRGQLYRMTGIPGETKNLYAGHPEIVDRLTRRLAEYRRRGGTRPGY